MGCIMMLFLIFLMATNGSGQQCRMSCKSGEECCLYNNKETCSPQQLCNGKCGQSGECKSNEQCARWNGKITCIKHNSGELCNEDRCGTGRHCCTLSGAKVCVPTDRQCCGRTLCAAGERCHLNAHGDLKCYNQWTKGVDQGGSIICESNKNCKPSQQCCFDRCIEHDQICCKNDHTCEKGQTCDEKEKICHGNKAQVSFCSWKSQAYCNENEQCCYNGMDGKDEYRCIPKDSVCCGSHFCPLNATCNGDGCTGLKFSQPCSSCGESNFPHCCYSEIENVDKLPNCVVAGSVCCHDGDVCPGNMRCAYDGFHSCMFVGETPCPANGMCGNDEPCCLDQNSHNQRRYCPPYNTTCE